MSTFRSALVALALVAFTTVIGCAEAGDDATANVCVSAPLLSPSCVTNTPSPGGTTLKVPTAEIRPKMDGDPSRDFIAILQLVSLSPSAGVIQNGTFRFSPSIRFRVDDLGQRGGTGINYWLYPSNDGVTKSGPEFGNGFINRPGVDDFFGTGGMFMMMSTPFRYILVEMKTTIYGEGERWAHHAFEVGYTQ